MSKTRSFGIIILTILLGSCSFWQAPVRDYPTRRSLTITTSIPKQVSRGLEYDLVVITDAGNNCFSVIQYFDSKDKLEVINFQQTIADEHGKCSWKWKVPLDTKSGTAEFRAYVEKEQETRYSIPDVFCIDDCQ